jgi:exodeoxyribonuclease-5
MIRPELPGIELAALPGGPEPVVLCATARLALDLRRAHGEARAARGDATWQALQSSTWPLWLDALVSRALLAGTLPAEAVGGGFLSRGQEAALWERTIAQEAGAAAELFDREGMAAAAMEAAALQRSWRLEVPEALHTAEYLAYRRWREAVGAELRRGGWRANEELLPWRIDCVARGAVVLPARVGLAGFVAPDPLLARLLAVLEERGVELCRVEFAHPEASSPRAVELADPEAECAAAAAWAAQRLAGGARRLRIAVADLPARRAELAGALDSRLHPERIGAGWAGFENAHAMVGGQPLAEQPLVDTALRLLQLLAAPRRVALADFGALLCAPGWSADLAEAEARARLERALRERLPPETGFDKLRREILRLHGEGIEAPRLVAQLDALADILRGASARRAPSTWAEVFSAALVALGWPGERALRAGEQAAVAALRERIGELGVLDAVLGRVDAGEALRRLRRACREQRFQPPRRGPPAVELCSLDDALGGPVDGLWLMGMNEGEWPPAPRPNPLLPAELLRRAGLPEARADLLAEAASQRQALCFASAAEVVCSWAARMGERPLRASPLLAGLPREVMAAPVPTPHVPGAIEALADEQAPPVALGEHVRGGTRLLAAQAACPAWGFFEFRLGAAVLPAPTFGLDASARGRLVHAALEAFWRGRDRAALLALGPSARQAAIAGAVGAALARHDREAPEPLPARQRELEAQRLAELVEAWLAFEAEREDFTVLACEDAHRLVIEGLPVSIVIDRVDRLADGRLAVIDYKTGRGNASSGWAESRIAEPQLPIYAALAFPEREVAAVALARVTREDARFVGIAADDGLLPGVKGLQAQRSRYSEEAFPDWSALRAAWAERVRALAREVRDGVAAVRVEDPRRLAWCPVLPLLRLAEAGLADEGDDSEASGESGDV